MFFWLSKCDWEGVYKKPSQRESWVTHIRISQDREHSKTKDFQLDTQWWVSRKNSKDGTKENTSKAEIWQHNTRRQMHLTILKPYEQLESSATERSKRRWVFAILSCSHGNEKELSGIHISAFFCYRVESMLAFICTKSQKM